jgi:uncharacterized protein (UPF0276 family)
MAVLRNAGVGLRHPHHGQALQPPGDLPVPAFVEVHAENFFGDGGAALQDLDAARAAWPLSLHGVGLGLGSAAGVDAWHLDRLQRLAARCEPLLVSDHACFGRVALQPDGPVLHGADLLPIAFTPASLAILVDNVGQVQDRLRRPILVENLAACLRWADDTLDEPDFLNQLARRSGCGLLLDVNNLVVNARNDHPDDLALVEAAARAWIDRIDSVAVGEIHLAGHDARGPLVIDDHGSAVDALVWRVFAHTVRRLGPRPTLVEWDQNLPPWPVLLGEAVQAQSVIDGCSTASTAVRQ